MGLGLEKRGMVLWSVVPGRMVHEWDCWPDYSAPTPGHNTLDYCWVSNAYTHTRMAAAEEPHNEYQQRRNEVYFE